MTRAQEIIAAWASDIDDREHRQAHELSLGPVGLTICMCGATFPTQAASIHFDEPTTDIHPDVIMDAINEEIESASGE